MKAKSVKRENAIIIAVVAVIIFLILLIFRPPFFNVIQRWRQLSIERPYLELYRQEAAEYVKNETDAVERYGEEIMPHAGTCYLGYTSGNNPKFSTQEEFEKEIKTIEMHVEVNNRATCVVLFEKNKSGQLEITKYWWE